jgi:hypothetical protein
MASMVSTTGKRVTVSIEEKARALQVIDIQESGVFAVRSATNARIAYAVYHNGRKVTGCACPGCKVYGRSRCAYRLAVAWKLEADRRAAYVETFNIYGDH